MALMLRMRLLACLLCLWSAAYASHAATPDCEQAKPVDWKWVAPGVWVWLPEKTGEISPDNQGHVLPISAIVDAGEAIVVDPGPSHKHGLRVRSSLACQFGAQVRWMRLLACLLCLWSAAYASHAATPDCEQAKPVDWKWVAPGVWVWLPEKTGEISPDNQGHVLPISAIVDAGEAIVVDPGPSHKHGLRVRSSLACQFGAQVRWVVNTHAHAESVLGNSAFADLQAMGLLDIAATAGTREAMWRRCEQCLSYLTSIVGAGVMRGTGIALPNRLLSEGETLAVGRIRLQVMQVLNAHTESDLLLWEPQRRVLWAGGLLYENRIPELAQGSLNGWLNALQRLTPLRPAVVVSTALSVAADADSLPQALEATRQYLQALRTSILQAMDAGLDGSDTRAIQLPDYAHWVGYRQRHGFNVQRAWRELEPEWLDASPSSVPDIRR